MTSSPTDAGRSPQALAPHTPLAGYYKDEVEHRAYLQKIFDDTAPDYERIENVLAFGSGRWYRRQALLRAMRTIDPKRFASTNWQ